MRADRDNIILWILLAAVALLNIAAQWGMYYSGDDFSYLSHFRYADGSSGHFAFPLDFPKFVVSHWLDQNGRMANYLAAVLLYALPERAVFVLNALMEGVMLWIVLRVAGCFRGSVLSGTLLLAVLAFCLPWWDSMQVFDCSVNYVWTTAAVLAFMHYVGRRPPRMPALAAIFGFIAGSMHEAAGLPLLAGLVCYYIIQGRKPDRPRLVALSGFAAGVAWCVLSPGIIARAGETVAPDDVLWLLLLKSCPITLLFVMVVCAASCVRKWRYRLCDLSRSPWIIYAVASVVSAGICAIGGIVGRSGWFSEIFALIAIWRLCAGLTGKIPNLVRMTLCGVLSASLLVHYSVFVYWQLKLGHQIEHMRSEYSVSEDGVVYMPEVVYEDRLPLCLMAKVRGVPDADDYYQTERFARYYSRGRKLLVVVPFDRAEVHRGIFPMTGGGHTLTDRRPEAVSLAGNERERSVLIVTKSVDGAEMVVTPFVCGSDSLYLISPRILDPGDR